MSCYRNHFLRAILSGLLIVFFAAGAAAQVPATNDDALLREMKWRNLGPANFAGRVVDVEALESDWTHVLCASASGGVWKSTNAGTTWTPIFDNFPTASIGDVALFQRDPNIIWVGTGEANNRNSVGWGDGIYKSTDGGTTFTNVGLRDTYQIARVVTHPTDPNVVYVAAIGNLWGSNGSRGLFKTADGGTTWTRLTSGLPDDGKTGATDLVMDPSNASILYVAFYQRLRQPWKFESGGPNGGIFKSTDAGKTWTKLTNGLPPGDTGRIGLAIYHKDPRIVMAIIEHGFQPQESDADYADLSKPGSGIYRSEDGGKTWKFVNRYNNRPFYYSQIRINPQDDQRVYVLTTSFRWSFDGGKTFQAAPLSFEGGLDNHAMWLDPNNKDRFYVGKDKGLTLTHDHGGHFLLFDNMPIAQFYAIGVDLRDPYYIYGGTQDNGSWGGPHFSRDVRGVQNDSWWKLHWGDGMFAQVDPTDWRQVYTEAENGSFRRYDAMTREVEMSRPTRENIVNYAERIKDEPRPPGASARWPFRFNWRAPMVMSPHNARTLYLGGNVLFRTVDGGAKWTIISPDLSTNDPAKFLNEKPGGLTRDATGAEEYCSITAISESPLVPGVLWVGTDDGNVQVTRDGGTTWTNVRGKIPGVPAGIWVSNVEAGHFDAGTAYVTFDGHRSSDFRPWVFKTTDYGATWTNITANIPDGHSMLVVREDLKNRNLLFAGSEFALFVSLNGGASWTRMGNGLPTVAVHDIVIHPRDRDVVIGTHGRGIYVLDDVTPLEQLNDAVLGSAAHLFTQRPATLWEDASRGGVRGHFFWAAENPPYIPKRDDVVRAKMVSGAWISYFVKSEGPATLEITDATGQLKRTLALDGKPGIGRVLWDLRWDPAPQQVDQFRQRLSRALERLQAMKGLSAEHKAVVAQAGQDLAAAQVADQLARIWETLNGLVDDAEITGVPLGQPLRGDEVGPAEYLLRLTAGGATAAGTLTVRRDPMLESK